jgi:hypothetical protein
MMHQKPPIAKKVKRELCLNPGNPYSLTRTLVNLHRYFYVFQNLESFGRHAKIQRIKK